MNLLGKRSPSPLPQSLDEILRPRTTHDKKKESESAATFISAAVQEGQEVVSLCTSFQDRLEHEYINDIIMKTTYRLAQEGKRLKKAPRLLSDGIAFDWVLDLTARNENIKTLLSVKGIRDQDLKRVLFRASLGGHNYDANQGLASIPCSLSLGDLNARTGVTAAQRDGTGSASEPIVITDDEGDASEIVPCTEPLEEAQILSRHKECSSSICRAAQPPHQVVDVPHLGESPLWIHRAIALSSEALQSHDRLSVVSYASRGAEISDGDNCYDTPSLIKPRSKAAAELYEGGADYGEWRHLAEDSSDIEMEAGHGSSRESSLSRPTPPQNYTHAGEGLSFFPHTYDTSDLQLPATGTSRTGVNLSKHTERDRSEHLRRPRNGLNTGEGESLVVRHPSRRHLNISDVSGDDSDNNFSGKVQKPRHVQRSQTGFRALHKVQPGSLAKGALQPQRSASDHLRSSRRSTSGEVNYDSPNAVEFDDELPASLFTASGHTIVIPKADYARGRRLLVPTEVGNPITTVLMRGEAHFIDQRQKTRMYQYSLPVQDDFRHVEDACLLGDGVVVVGYDKGPSQVSLITVRGRQRPSRIDIIHKAHSTVMENRSAGRAYPNRGISCLASVADCSFLSGGHDKYVYHWKLELERACNRKEHNGFSASSVRVPTEHTQAVQALAFCAWSDTVYSAAGDRIAMTKLGAIARAETERLSGKVTQVHVHPQDPRLIAIEVDHMDYQVHFYDMREGGFSRKPWLEFGYRASPQRAARVSPSLTTINAGSAAANQANANTNPLRSTSSTPIPKLGSRYTRGSTINSLFARGYSDGAVLVWDCRNGARKKVLERFHFGRSAEVVHTVLAGSDVIAYGGYSLTFWSMLAPGS